MPAFFVLIRIIHYKGDKMSNITRSVLEKEISQCNQKLSEHNDGSKVIVKIKSEVTKLIKSSIRSANSTSSIDERLKCLLEGLQAIMNFVEDSERLHLSQYNRHIANAELLKEILDKVDKKIEEEKKDTNANKSKQEPKDI